jgi:SAM-dependent methyltransferase
VTAMSHTHPTHAQEASVTTTAPTRTRTGSGYVLDPAWHAERERLTSLTSLYDGTTLQLAEHLGLRPGWRCADLGAGTGTVARLLAERVGPSGSVLAVDTDTRFLDVLADDVLTVRRQDVTDDALPAGAFDLVHARLLLEHLPTRDAVLPTMAATVAPGGWLLVEDFDWAETAVIDPAAPVHAKVAGACQTVMRAHGYDPNYGRRLPRALAAAGLADVGTHAASAVVPADPVAGVPQWELLVAQLAPVLLAQGLVTPADLAAFSALCHDGDTVVFAPLMVSCWGRRPA